MPVYPNSLNPVDGRKQNYNSWNNISFFMGMLSGDCKDKNAEGYNWLTIEQFIEYCDNWKELQSKKIESKQLKLNDHYNVLIDYNIKLIYIGGQQITFEKVREIYNECFKINKL